MEKQLIRKKIIGGLLGKAVGGTLGGPTEGSIFPLNLSYYNPVPDKMLPNDDLDLQVLWMCKISTDWQGVLSARNFGQAWLDSIFFYCDEYGTAIRNLEIGVLPPWSGTYDNAFTDGLGAAIRSEIWAFLAPGKPELATRYAEYDAQVDHCGDGIYGALYLAALESLAFTNSDINFLLREALKYIPATCRIAQVVTDTIRWCCESTDAKIIRKKILGKYGSPSFTDTVMNLGFEVMALLLSQGDFSQAICLAVNCGRDTDCTGATVGAILGIINPEGIDEKWLRPIGNQLVVSPEIHGIKYPETLDAFADLIIAWQDKIVCGEKTAPEPEWSKYSIPALSGISKPDSSGDFTRSPLVVPSLEPVMLPGNMLKVDFSQLPGDAFQVYELKFQIPADGRYAIVVSTTAKSVTRLDGEVLLGQANGAFVPAPHRALVNQSKRLALTAGEHTLRIALAPCNEDQLSAPLLFTITNEKFRWLINPFIK